MEENNILKTPMEFMPENNLISDKIPEKVIVESDEDAEVVKMIVEVLQSVGRKMDKSLRSASESEEEYREKTQVSELLKTRFGKDYLIVVTLLGMILKTPTQAYALASVLTNVEDFETFLHSIDVVYDANKGVIDIVSIDEQQDQKSTLITL